MHMSKKKRTFAASKVLTIKERTIVMPEKKPKSKTSEPAEEVKAGKTRREKLSNYLIDISKYVMTGVVIASLVKDLDDNRTLIYVLGLLIALFALCAGLILTDKKKGK